MCFASPRKRARHSHNSVEMTPFWENVLGTVFGKAARNEGSSLVAVARRSRPGFLLRTPIRFRSPFVCETSLILWIADRELTDQHCASIAPIMF
jgi:hypothetical protein